MSYVKSKAKLELEHINNSRQENVVISKGMGMPSLLPIK